VVAVAHAGERLYAATIGAACPVAAQPSERLFVIPRNIVLFAKQNIAAQIANPVSGKITGVVEFVFCF